MTRQSEARRCPECAPSFRERAFDLVVRGAGDDERIFFGLSASLCPACGHLALDMDVARILGIDEADVTCAIESDRCLLLGDSSDAA